MVFYNWVKIFDGVISEGDFMAFKYVNFKRKICKRPGLEILEIHVGKLSCSAISVQNTLVPYQFDKARMVHVIEVAGQKLNVLPSSLD